MIEEDKSVVLSKISGPQVNRQKGAFGCLILFLLFFALPPMLGEFRMFAYLVVGLLVAGFVGYRLYHFTSVNKPETQVILNSSRIYPGDRVHMTWQIKKNQREARRLRITLLGFEKALDTRGSGTSTHETIFHKEQIEDMALNGRFSAHHTFSVPPNTYPTLQAKSNYVIWVLQFKYDMGPLWPDHVETYSFDVLPYLPDDAYAELQKEEEIRDMMEEEQAAQVRDGLEQSPTVIRSLLQPLVDRGFNKTKAQIGLGPRIQQNWAVPPGEVQIELNGRSAAFRPGERISGTVSWQLSAPVDYLDLRLRWYLTGKGDPDERVVQVISRQYPGQSDRMPFELTLPFWPHSLDGKYIALHWGLDVAVRLPDEQRRSVRQFLRGNAFPEQRIIISPTREPLQTTT